MSMFLLSIDEIFCVPNQGLLLVSNNIEKELFLKTGDNIKLITLENSIILTSIIGVVFEKNGILISNDFKKEDISCGTEVWLN